MPAITWTTGRIYIPQTDLTLVSGTLYEHDISELHLQLRDLQDDVNQGRPWSRTHVHNTQVLIAGVIYVRQVLILPPYFLEYEDGQYSVKQIGANTNAGDVAAGRLFQNQVQVIPSNSAGLQVVPVGSGLSAEQAEQLIKIYRALMLDPNHSVRNQRFDANNSRITFDDVVIDLVGPEDSDVLGTRQP